MATDTAILVAGQGGAPLDYLVPDAQELIPLSARAVVDGSGAASAFLPVIQLISDAGLVLAEAITDATVAAGGSAQVSWFPRVGGGGASTASAAAWFFASRVTNFTVSTVTPNRRIPWTHIRTSDSAVFTTTTGLAADDTVVCHAPGIYIAVANVVWAAPSNYPHSCEIITDFFGVSPTAQTPVTDTTTATVASGRPYNMGDAMLAITQTTPGELSLTAHNWDGANHDVTQAFYAIQYIPNATLVT